MKFQTYALITLILVGVVFNCFMLTGGGGMAGADALTVSVVQVTFNILSSFLLGKVLLGHILHAESLLKRISTSILFLAHIYSIIVLNMNMGIYRQIITNATSTVFETQAVLLVHFDWTPFPPQMSLDKMSVIGIGVGLVFAFLAYWDGFKSDDSFPGYGHEGGE